jgi:HEAT repeat protein
MSHSKSDPERGWDYGLNDEDHVALVHCERRGDGPLDWGADPLVQYLPVAPLREAFAANRIRVQRPKGAGEGFEVRITWPSAVAAEDGTVEEVLESRIRYRARDGRLLARQLRRKSGDLTPLVKAGEEVRAHQILASVAPVAHTYRCAGGAGADLYLGMSTSASLSDRYTAVKALGRFDMDSSTAALQSRMSDAREHVYVRLEAAAGLLRRQSGGAAAEFLTASLSSEYRANRLETAIVLGEVGGAEATRLLLDALGDAEQDPEIRAGAAWSLGELGNREALPPLIESFVGLETVIQVEAARALAKLARRYLDDVVAALPRSKAEQRPGIAWALSKAGGVTVGQLMASLVDDDARQWIAYVIGTQSRDAMLPQIEVLAKDDPEVYFAATVLWKILGSWTYGLEEY